MQRSAPRGSGAIGAVPAGSDPWVDTRRPNVARMQDYLLGGGFHFGADRVAAEALLEAFPAVRTIARVSADFRTRAVRYLLDQGVRQFLDLGPGLPTAGGVPGIVADACGVHAGADVRVVGVDIDPVVTALLESTGHPNAAVICADLTDPATARQACSMLDLRRPVGLLATSVMEFVPDAADPAGVLTGYCDELPVGSYLVLSHLTPSAVPAVAAAALREITAATLAPAGPRSVAAVEPLVERDGWALVPPGLRAATRWRPTDPDRPPLLSPLAGVATRRW